MPGQGSYVEQDIVNLESDLLALRRTVGDLRNGLKDLSEMRNDLGIPVGKGTLTRLDINGQTFYGISAHGQNVTLIVNPISATHAETDVFQQAQNANIRGGQATLWIDRAMCGACDRSGAVRSMARQLGITDLRVETPEYVREIRPME